MIKNNLTEKNFMAYAIKNYYSSEHINTEEFIKSIKTITYINRLLKKTDNINHRLILNHIIITANTFSVKSAIKMFMFKISDNKHIKIMTYLFFLGYLYDTDKKNIDYELLKILEKL